MPATIETALAYIIKNIPAVLALPAVRVWDTVMPDNAQFPAVTFQLVSRSSGHTLSDRVNLASRVYQVTSWALDKKQVIDLARGIMLGLDAFRGVVQINGSGLPTGIISGSIVPSGGSDIVVAGVMLLNEIDLFDSETKVYYRAQDFRVIFYEG